MFCMCPWLWALWCLSNNLWRKRIAGQMLTSRLRLKKRSTIYPQWKQGKRLLISSICGRNEWATSNSRSYKGSSHGELAEDCRLSTSLGWVVCVNHANLGSNSTIPLFLIWYYVHSLVHHRQCGCWRWTLGHHEALHALPNLKYKKWTWFITFLASRSSAYLVGSSFPCHYLVNLLLKFAPAWPKP